MRTRYSVCIDAKPMHDIDPSIYVIDITENAPANEILTMKNGGRDGSRRLHAKRQSLSVSVRFMVREYDTVRRKRIFGDIVAWAQKGKYLTISDRPEQRLRVVCDTPPTVNSSLKWTETQEIIFTAYDSPYWESVYPDKATASGESGKATLFVGGTAAKAYLSFSAVNIGTAPLTDLTVTANSTKMHFASINVPVNGAIEAYYDDDGYLHIPMENRTPDSNDDLIVNCGAFNEVSFTADQKISATFSARGRFE